MCVDDEVHVSPFSAAPQSAMPPIAVRSFDSNSARPSAGEMRSPARTSQTGIKRVAEGDAVSALHGKLTRSIADVAFPHKELDSPG